VLLNQQHVQASYLQQGDEMAIDFEYPNAEEQQEAARDPHSPKGKAIRARLNACATLQAGTRLAADIAQREKELGPPLTPAEIQLAAFLGGKPYDRHSPDQATRDRVASYAQKARELEHLRERLKNHAEQVLPPALAAVETTAAEAADAAAKAAETASQRQEGEAKLSAQHNMGRVTTGGAISSKVSR
jgi:hypothetical protein